MKKIYTFLLLTLVNLSFSQDARIFENEWHLTNVIVNGVDNFPPNGNMNIYFVTPTEFYAHACNTMYASVVFENNNTNFSATNYAYTLDICSNPAAESYQNIYFPFFLDETNPEPFINTNYFTYAISEAPDGVRTLVINSMFNQQAVYSSVMLSKPAFEKSPLSFFPNPAHDFLELTTKFTENAVAVFYNDMGQICKTAPLNQRTSKIDLQDLASGVYLVKISTKSEAITKKLIKL